MNAGFIILNGVRRAKAAEACGFVEIEAEVFDADGRKIADAVVPLDQLWSPKDKLDLTRKSVDLVRYLRLPSLFLAGVTVDPIEVTAGSIGTRLDLVEVIT